MNFIENGDFFSGFASGAVSSLLSSGFEIFGNGLNPTLQKVGMIAVGGVSGGLSSVIAGGNFWSGMRQGLITSGLNHFAHSALEKGVDQQSGAKKEEEITDEINVLNESDWETQMPDKKACFKTCSSMAEYTPNLKNAIQMLSIDNTGQVISSGNLENGINTIKQYLSKNKPIIVGVERSPGAANSDKITDHYIVIMGSGKLNGKDFFRFFDPGTARSTAGASKLNRLYIDNNSGTITGQTQYSGRMYTVSQVRPQ